ncbi:MAG: tyrosinase family protein [Fuerstiella sp.]|nr:tyrosinase family protein [Fuerstiella sp.]
MKRFIAILTLILITALSADNVSAAQPGVSEELYAGLYSPNTGEDHPNLHHCFVDYVWALWQDCNDYDVTKDAFRPFVEGTPHALPHLSYPELGGQEGEDLVGLWFELVDAGYTEDEAFQMIEMVLESDQETSRVFNYDVSYEKGSYSSRGQYRCYSCGLCGD